jgi:hypothetical protein
MYQADAYQPLVEILETHIELASEDEMGQVVGGHLRLRGQLFEIECRGKRNSFSDRIFVNGQETRFTVRRDDGGYSIASLRSLYCLPIDMSFESGLWLNALVLRKAAQSEDFRRVGVVHRHEFLLKEGPAALEYPFLQAIEKVAQNSKREPTLIQDPSSLREVKII